MSVTLSVPAPAAVNIAQARFMPIVEDSMAPGLPHGGMVAVVPVSGYRCVGLYVLDVPGDGSAAVLRCEALGENTIRVWHDSPAYGSHTVTRDWFESAVLGQVAAVLRIVDTTLLDDMMATSA